MIKEYTNKKNIDEFIDFFSDEYIAYIKADKFYKFSEIVPFVNFTYNLNNYFDNTIYENIDYFKEFIDYIKAFRENKDLWILDLYFDFGKSCAFIV